MAFYGSNSYQGDSVSREIILFEEPNEIETDKFLNLLKGKINEVNINLSNNEDNSVVKKSVLKIMDNNNCDDN